MAQTIKTLQFLGHSAVVLKSQGYTIAIDPWLEGNPSCPEKLKNPERLDLIVLTHGHSDHAGDAPRLAKQTGAKIAATYELCNIMVREGVDQSQIVYMNKGGTVDVDGYKISLTNAFHSSSYDTSEGPVYAGEACGVVIQDDSNVIYHAGDTALFADMALIKDSYAPKIALLPIGDRFTMGPKEAAQAAKLIGAKSAIPIHHSTFPLLSGTPEEFKDACSALNIRVVTLECGQEIEIPQ